MSDESRELVTLMVEVESFLAEGSSRSYADEKALGKLRELSFELEQVMKGDNEIKERFLTIVTALKDICVESRHPNEHKERPLYERIQKEFPSFHNPLADDELRKSVGVEPQ
ncbi:MAG: hypothetical protein DHS20C02_06660 [Micavibrio sp.]|nr:MAG: hypothetical protein DHS20C02_06660 [Micavibrio sp.]